MIISTSGISEAAEMAFEAAGRGDMDQVLKLADTTFHMEECDIHGNSILHYAVRGGNVELVRFLTEICGLDPAWANKELVTPYDLAYETSVAAGTIGEIEKYFRDVCGFSHESCYRNPVVRGMYPDPSIVRVGDDYYMVNSSFIYFPGIPISHSRDLVHWKVIGHVMTDPDWALRHLGPLDGGRGFWAPDISYHDGWFYVCATLRLGDDAPCIQTQIVTRASLPQGPYEEPVIHPVRGIDPSIFTDDDGQRYMLLNRGARIMKISPDGKKCLSSPRMIWYGSNKHGPEGPHLLKKDGYYYCFLAEGGTGKGHQISVARARTLYGPYEDCPYNPVMTQKDSAGAIQCCGHGKPVSTPDGRWYMVYLCSRFIDGRYGMLGRETCLDEIQWTADGWPMVNHGRGPSYMAHLPFRGIEKGEAGTGTGAGTKAMQPCSRLPWGDWVSPRTISGEHIRLEADGSIEITGDGLDLCHQNCRSLLLKRQPDFTFQAEFQMDIIHESVSREDGGQDAGFCGDAGQGASFSGDAGLVLYYDENTYIKFGITKTCVFVAEYIDNRYVRRQERPFSYEGNALVLRIETEGLCRGFLLNGQLICRWEDVTSICSEGFNKGKRFTGAMYGVYNNGTNIVRWRQHG